MSVLDTFYILFKTNADDVKRGMDQVNKAAKETEKNLQNTNEKATILGETFVKLVEGVVELASGASAFELIKAGVEHQTNYNNELRNTAILYKQNVGLLKGYAQMAATASGNDEDRAGAIGGFARLLSNNTWAKGDPMQVMLAQRARYQSLAGSPASQNDMLYGAHAVYQTEGERLMLSMDKQHWDALQNTSGVKAAGSLTPEQAEAAHNEESAKQDLEGAWAKFDTTLGSGFMKLFDGLTQGLAAIVSSMGSNIYTAVYAAAAVVFGGSLLGGGLAKGIATSVLGLGATAVEGVTVASVGGAAAAGS